MNATAIEDGVAILEFEAESVMDALLSGCLRDATDANAVDKRKMIAANERLAATFSEVAALIRKDLESEEEAV